MSLLIATSRVGEGRSVGEVVVVLGRVTQLLLHAAATMSMRLRGELVYHVSNGLQEWR